MAERYTYPFHPGNFETINAMDPVALARLLQAQYAEPTGLMSILGTGPLINNPFNFENTPIDALYQTLYNPQAHDPGGLLKMAELARRRELQRRGTGKYGDARKSRGTENQR